MRQLTTIILTFLSLTLFGQSKDSINSTDYVFVGEPMPSYPGGQTEMIKFIKENLRYPQDSRTVRGKVFVEVIVNENGSLSDFRVAKGLGDSFDNCAIQTVKKMPNWIPAKKNKKPIRTKIIIPVTFD